MEMKQILTRKLRIKNYTLPLVVTILIIINIFTSERSWEIMLAGFGAALFLSFVSAIFLWRGLNFRRELRQGFAQVGDTFSEQFNISNKSPFQALAVTVIDHSNFPGYKSSFAWTIGRRFDRLWFRESVCPRRGLYNVGPTEIRTQDPFGVFEISIFAPFTKEILITPPIIPLHQIKISSGNWHGDGSTKPNFLERTVTSGSVREYVSGDSLFSIHWLTTARRDDLHVRTYDQQPSSDWWVILDMDSHVQAGKGLEATEEYATILAASLIDRGLKENRAVGLISQGWKQIWLPPKTGAGQRSEIMHALAEADLGNLSLKDLLTKAHQSIGRKSSAIIITPSADPEWLAALHPLKQHGITTTALLLDQQEFGGQQSILPILNKLDAWGIRHYKISKNIYAPPKAEGFFPGQRIALLQDYDPAERGA
ncbi:DUF58 domain-containing protein [bacterium]|nr:DUF58 domain-containing protein [bacterium]